MLSSSETQQLSLSRAAISAGSAPLELPLQVFRPSAVVILGALAGDKSDLGLWLVGQGITEQPPPPAFPLLVLLILR